VVTSVGRVVVGACVGACVVGDDVEGAEVGASVVGGCVVGADVVGFAVVGASVVAGCVVGADVVGFPVDGASVEGTVPSPSNIATSAQLMNVSCRDAHPRQQSPSGAHPHVFPNSGNKSKEL
jgi:hypothetical protein